MYIIFSDVDGTIYGSDKKIHKDNFNAIKVAQEAGIKFVIATGNPKMDKMEELAEQLNANYLITSTGATLYDLENNKLLFQNTFAPAIASQVLEITKKEARFIIWNTPSDLFFYGIDKDKKYSIEVCHDFFTNKISPIEKNIITQDVVKMSIGAPKHIIEKLVQTIPAWGLNFSHNDHYIEITSDNSSKGKAVEYLANHLNVDLNNVMTIGDSSNDISMFNVTPNSYAMANGTDKAIKTAKRYTSAVEQGGLAEAIHDFMFRHKLK